MALFFGFQSNGEYQIQMDSCQIWVFFIFRFLCVCVLGGGIIRALDPMAPHPLYANKANEH